MKGTNKMTTTKVEDHEITDINTDENGNIYIHLREGGHIKHQSVQALLLYKILEKLQSIEERLLTLQIHEMNREIK